MASNLQNAMSADEHMDRKKKKPVMEKVRRDRINAAIKELKTFVMKQSPNQSASKLEQADVLEKMVEFTKSYERQQDQLQQMMAMQLDQCRKLTIIQILRTIFLGMLNAKMDPSLLKDVYNFVLPLLSDHGLVFQMFIATLLQQITRSTATTASTTSQASPSVSTAESTEHDDTFSSVATPINRRGIKRRREDQDNDSSNDSGISEDGPSPPKKFSVEDLLKK